MDASVAAVTPSGTGAEAIEPTEAAILVLPIAALVARPALLTDATVVFDELQLACALRFCVVLSV
jgi:hypothetical protein